MTHDITKPPPVNAWCIDKNGEIILDENGKPVRQHPPAEKGTKPASSSHEAPPAYTPPSKPSGGFASNYTEKKDAQKHRPSSPGH